MITKISLQEQRAQRQSEGWFYIVMAIIAIVIAIAGFGPAAVSTTSRRAPLTWALISHGAIFGAWLLLFLIQTILITKRKIVIHRRVGFLGALLALLMVVSGYITAIAMARRGYDLSGDLIQGKGDPLELLVFQLGDLLSFSILVGLAIWYRSNPAVHKRLMLLATMGSMMPAALTHIIGHSPVLREITAPIIVFPLFMLLFARAVYDRLSQGSIHPISLWVALALFVWSNLRAVVIGPSEAWHNFAEWLIK
jgi:uncharacterized membrane protein YozB (DUF420 family)